MSEPTVTSSAIVDAHGKPARQKKDERCPSCGAGPEKRVASSGFGRTPHPICTGGCSPAYEWVNEVFRG
jgi:hypothetical protein